MSMSQKPVNMHKRIAMGDTVKGYAKGGKVGMPEMTPMKPQAGTGKVSADKNPLVAARRNNGVPGMMKGGKVGGKKC